MAKASKAALKANKLDAIADRGYFNRSQILTYDQTQITATVPRPETSGNRKKGMFVTADFTYDAEVDIYICPARKKLTYRYTREECGLMHRQYWQSECQRCPLQSRCTTGKERRITRREHERLIDKAIARMKRDPDLMRTRRSTVEHPFGTLKAWMGPSHFLTRGLQNVGAEMALRESVSTCSRWIMK